MFWLVLAGLMVGAGLAVAASGLFPAPTPLASLAAGRSASLPGDVGRSPSRRLLSPRKLEQYSQDLRVLDRSPAKHESDLVVNTLVFAALPFIMLLLSLSGVLAISPVVLLVVTIAAGIGGWSYTGPALRRSAKAARQEFEESLATYLELVSLAFAGGQGPHDALTEPAMIGTGPVFQKLRLAMSAAQERREAPWITLAALGDQLGIQSLVDLGASITLASDGAPVVETLRAKSDSLRDQIMAQQEARAEARSETMSGPIVLMFGGFLILFGYPALAGLMALQ